MANAEQLFRAKAPCIMAKLLSDVPIAVEALWHGFQRPKYRADSVQLLAKCGVLSAMASSL